MNMREFFEMYGITPNAFLNALQADAANADIRITASELCKKTGDGTVTQERIEAIRAAMDELDKQRKIRLLCVYNGKCDGFPSLKDYLFIANKPFSEVNL